MRSQKGVFATPFFLFLALFLSGCASSTISGYRQPVLVTSDPPGAAVYERGQYLGTTPGYMRVRRRHHPVLEFRHAGQTPKVVRLTTQYRWYDSFWGNALFLTLAPIGWTVDWATGTAWEVQNPPLGNTALPAKGARLAISPPEMKDRDLADAVGAQLEAKFRNEGRFNVQPYEQTLRHFDYFEVTNTLPTDLEDRNGLLAAVQSEAVFLSTATEDEKGIQVKGEVKNAFSGERIAEKEFTLSRLDNAGMPIRKQIPRYFHLLPNTAFVNFTSFRATMNIDGVETTGQAVSDGSAMEDVMKVVGAVGLTRLQRPRANSIARWTFDFVPSINLSMKRIRYQFFLPPQDQDFDRIYASVGYGLEVGYQWRYGFPYLDLIPTATWSQLTYDANQSEKVLDSWSTTFVFELGYQYFFSDHFVAKLFTRSLQEDTDLWKKAVSDIFGQDKKVETATTIVSGIAIGYYFPSAARKIR